MLNPQRLFPFHYGWVIVVTGILTLFTCLGMARFAYGMLLPGMREGLGLAYDQLGYVGTGNFIGYLISVAMTPTLLRKLRPRITISLGLFLIAVSMVGMAQCTAFLPLLLLYSLTGVGSGLANIPTMVLISHWFQRERRGRAAGLMVIGSGLAIVLAGLVIPQINQIYEGEGWRVSLQLLAVLAVAVSLLVITIVRNDPQDLGLKAIGHKQEISEEELFVAGTVNSGHILLFLGLLYSIFGATYMVYGTFIVTSMVDEHGFSQAAAGQFWSWVGFFSIFSGIVFGSLSDRIGRRGGLMVVFTVQTVAYLLAGSGLGDWTLLLSVFLYGIAAWSIPAIMTAAVGDFLGVAKAAAGLSLITFFFAGGQTVGPAVAGMIAETGGSFAPAFLLSALLTAAAVLLALKLPKPRGKKNKGC